MSFFIPLGLPTCFINIFISNLDDVMNTSDIIVVLAIRSISVEMKNKISSTECYLKGRAFLLLRKKNNLFYRKA